MGDLGLPAPAADGGRRLPAAGAVELLRDVLAGRCGAGERVTLVPLAPLTNIALLLRMHPEVARGLGRIVFMGGAARRGNATAAAEFNVFHDPEAAAIVLDAASELAVPITMYGLDVFYESAVAGRAGRAARRGRAPRRAARRAARALPVRPVRGRRRHPRGRRRRVRRPRPARARDPAAAGAGRAHGRVDARPDGGRPPALAGAPRPRPARNRADARSTSPSTVDGPRYADLWLKTVSGPAGRRAPTAGPPPG